jgi:hypothetical protein
MRAVALALVCSVCAGNTRRVQPSVEKSQHGRDWELDNYALSQGGQMNDAELGLANLKMAMHEPSKMSEIAQYLRSSEGRAELVKMMANPDFQEQATHVVEKMKTHGIMADFLKLEHYADKQVSPQALQTLLLSLNPGASSSRSAQVNSRDADVRMETLEDLKSKAKELNPIGYFDPLGLGKASFWDQSNEATIGFLRHAEIKHGRVAMAGFVGYCLHENGIRWPWALSTSLPDYSSFDGLSAPAVWDATPQAGRLQILIIIGFFEFWSESRYVLESDGTTHYMRGGKPGYFPTFKEIPHPVPWNLWDPFGFTKKAVRRKEEQIAQC